MGFIRKCFTFLSFLFIISLLLINCSQDKNSAGPDTEDQYAHIHWNADSLKVEFKNLPTIDVDGEQAIQLSSFINRDIISDTAMIIVFEDKDGNTDEGRKLYSNQMIGDDGFSATVKGYANNV